MRRIYVVMPDAIPMDRVREAFPEFQKRGLFELVKVATREDLHKVNGVRRCEFLLHPGPGGNDPVLVDDFMATIAGREFKEYQRGECAGCCDCQCGKGGGHER